LDLSCDILKAFAIALGQDENFFEESHRNQENSHSTTLRFLHYPPIQEQGQIDTSSQSRAGWVIFLTLC
jgi:isopenicillin N synthase-like dioxygenase